MLKVINLTANVENRILFENCSLTLKPGEVHLLMGPNGAGKSSLAKAIIGWPDLEVKKGSIKLNGKDISKLELDERAKAGLFLAHQSPVEVPGVHMVEFLRTSHNILHPDEQLDPWAFKEVFEAEADALGLGSEFTQRNLNEGFSGGEKKKSEVLQMIMLRPKYAFLDEIDSGLDIDSLKQIFDAVSDFAQKGDIGILVISHNPKILQYLTPDTVYLMKDHTISETGGVELAKRILKKGYVTKN